MTKEQIKAWTTHFQNRFILEDNPVPLHGYLIDMLFRAYTDDSCVKDICAVVSYLNCNLPALVMDYPNAFPKPLEEYKVSDPCSNPLDISINIKLSPNLYFYYMSSFTLLNNPEYFTFKEDGCYYFNIRKFIDIPSNVLPNNLYFGYKTKANVNSPFITILQTEYIGYYNE